METTQIIGWQASVIVTVPILYLSSCSSSSTIQRKHPLAPQQACDDLLDELNDPATQMSGLIRAASSVPTCHGVLDRMTIPILDVGDTLCTAAWGGNMEYIEKTVSIGFDPDSRTDRTAMTPLMCAVAGGQLPTAQFLLDAGADVNAVWEEWWKDGEIRYWTVTEYARERCDSPEVRALFGLPPRQPEQPVVFFDGCGSSDSSR